MPISAKMLLHLGNRAALAGNVGYTGDLPKIASEILISHDRYTNPAQRNNNVYVGISLVLC